MMLLRQAKLHLPRPSVVFGLCLLPVLLTGCGDRPQTLTTDMNEDFTHSHKHHHGPDDDHEHHHAEGASGFHSHSHEHPHRHGESAAGGNIVSIGHTHHGEGVAHYHAEVMPMEGRRIQFALMTESGAGELERMALSVAEVPALIGVEDVDSGSQSVVFSAVDDSNSEFALEVPEDLLQEQSYLVVVPMIKIDGQRQNFSFRINRAADDQPAVDGESS